jgi:hypothetical protein
MRQAAWRRFDYRKVNEAKESPAHNEPGPLICSSPKLPEYPEALRRVCGERRDSFLFTLRFASRRIDLTIAAAFVVMLNRRPYRLV